MTSLEFSLKNADKDATLNDIEYSLKMVRRLSSKNNHLRKEFAEKIVIDANKLLIECTAK